MTRVHSYLAMNNLENSRLPWEKVKDTDISLKERLAKIKAIKGHLGVAADGTLIPLTLRQTVYFKDPISKLEYKIEKTRKQCDEIIEKIESFNSYEDDIKNTKLIRYFILECMSPFKRHILEVTNQRYDNYTNLKISWIIYVTAWVIFTLIICFLIYWIFAWGIYQGDETISAWGKIYGTGALNDILLVQITKIFILYYLPSQAMQPQLIRIRKVLSDVTINYINKNEYIYNSRNTKNNNNNNSNNSNNYSKYNIQNNNSQKNNFGRNSFLSVSTENVHSVASEISVVQHMSAACRAARSKELRELPAAWLLRQVRELVMYDKNIGIMENEYCTVYFLLIFLTILVSSY